MSDDVEFTEVAKVAEPAQFQGLAPSTRRLIIFSLAVVTLAAIISEVVLVTTGNESSEALLTLAATAVGGLAGMALPGGH